MKERNNRIFLVFLGLIIALLAIEGIARLAGSIYGSSRFRSVKAHSGGQQVRILCLGDSFTFGLGAAFGQDYPAQLEALLNRNSPDKKFVCLNRGVPGNNSSMLLKELVGSISSEKPDLVIVLIGSNDATTLEDNEYILFRLPDKGASAGLLLKLDVILSKSRAYKLAKIAVLNLKTKFKPAAESLQAIEEKNIPKSSLGPALSPEKEEFIRKIEEQLKDKNFTQAEAMIERMPGGIDRFQRRQCLLLADIYAGQEKYAQAITLLEDYLKTDPQDSLVAFELGRNYYYQGQLSPETGGQGLRRSIDLFNRSNADLDMHYYYKARNYGYLARVYFSLGDNAQAEKMINEALNIYPAYQFARQFRKVLREATYSEKEKEVFRKATAYNLEKIINICRLYNTGIILLGYPSETKGSLRKDVAQALGVPFVDVAQVFTKAKSGNPQQELFSSDRAHPNALGYGLIAQALEQKLEQTGVF